ncbi:MAG: tripartite tricarboxylate transporter substrate binding protein [Betaproteobacteria bacterium]|nr:tripartite tricarboxylate transporter substrate binding protein [Betaproteobacteria bacterium]
MEFALVSCALARSVRLVAFSLSVLAAAAAPVTISAQTYPAKPVRFIVPAAPGGGLDLVARIAAGKLTELWNQPVLVENKPGANFIIGTDFVAKSPPDGHTLLLTASAALTINPIVFPDLPYRPARDFVPITLLTEYAFVLLVNNSVPANSVQQLLAHLRANPGKLNHASNSASTMLVSELFKSLANVDYADINYKGGVLAAAATAAGETQFCFVDIGSGMGQMKAGRVRALAVAAVQRYKLQPEIPTLAEAGVPRFSAATWSVVLAPSRTPAEIVTRVNADLRRVLSFQDVLSKMEATGTVAVGNSSEEASRVLLAETEKRSQLVKERNIRFK